MWDRKQQLELDMEQLIGSKLGKEHDKAVYSPCLFNLYAEYIMQKAGLDESQTRIKIAGRNINNLRYLIYLFIYLLNLYLARLDWSLLWAVNNEK